MAAVLGIDAAWTEHNASGFALVERDDGRWRLRAAASCPQCFAHECGLRGAEGLGANLALRCAENALGGRLPDLIAVDMPLSRQPIVGRRASDLAVSRRFGGQKCATHSPSAERPGRVSLRLHEDCKARGYVLLTSWPASHARSLAEVYPHPALLRLMQADERLRYKVGKTCTYWPAKSSAERLALLKDVLAGIIAALDEVVAGAEAELGRRFDLEGAKGFSALKPIEDTIDAIVCAWVGAIILDGAAEPFGDEDSAIWVPRPAWAQAPRAEVGLSPIASK
jgi:predicted RNase H-like nuclease